MVKIYHIDGFSVYVVVGVFPCRWCGYSVKANNFQLVFEAATSPAGGD